MYLKFIGVCASLCVYAALAAAPGMAASAVLYSGETKVPVGTEVVATSGTVTFGGMFSCTSSNMAGYVEKNDSSSGIYVALNSSEFKGTGSEGRCQVGFESARIFYLTRACLSNTVTFTPTAWSLEGGFCTSRGPIELVYIGTVAGNCKYSRASQGLVDSSPLTEPLQMTTNSSSYVKNYGGAGCPSISSVNATYELRTALGAKLKVVQ